MKPSNTQPQKNPNAEKQEFNKWALGADYEVIRELGHGSYARVYEAIETKSGKTVAVKKFIRALAHPQLAQYCLREIEILSKVPQNNIIKMHKVMRSNQSVYIILDCVPSDLRKLIHSQTFLTHEEVKAIMYEIFLALNYLHCAKIVHRDIKPGNILCSNDLKIKLCDFGLARSISGLKITAFDFDQIYRTEFAESNEANLVQGLAQKVGYVPGSKDYQEEMPEDLDEHVVVNSQFRMPRHFDIGFNSGNKGKILSPIDSTPAQEYDTIPMPVKDGNILSSTASYGNVTPELKGEDQKSMTAKPRSVNERRAEFIKSLKPDPLMERELTGHIASRWYRAPEVILLEKAYSGGVDIWGTGCVFAELLQMIKENKVLPGNRTALFPGTSCFPLSPQVKPNTEGEVEHFQAGDQLITICNVIGTPSEEQAKFITDLGAKQYMSLLPKSEGINMKEKYPDCTIEEFDLLNKMLTFNPYGRITAKEALRHLYFKSVRCKPKEIVGEIIQLDTEVADTACIEKLKSFCDKQSC
jgi:serine/threonine protein kinase